MQSPKPMPNDHHVPIQENQIAPISKMRLLKWSSFAVVAIFIGLSTTAIVSVYWMLRTSRLSPCRSAEPISIQGININENDFLAIDLGDQLSDWGEYNQYVAYIYNDSVVIATLSALHIEHTVTPIRSPWPVLTPSKWYIGGRNIAVLTGANHYTVIAKVEYDATTSGFSIQIK